MNHTKLITLLSPSSFNSAKRSAVFLSFAFILAGGALAQWTVVNLHPAEATYSYGSDVSNGQQVGSVGINGVEQAVVWNGTAASWVNLNPSGSTRSFAGGVDNSFQVGSITDGDSGRASLWNGTAVSCVNLHPAGAAESFCRGVGDGQQVGQVYFTGPFRASLWSGTSISWVNLHPAGATESLCNDVSGGQQVGTTILAGTQYRASLWTGTATSWVNLNPAGSASSFAHGVEGGQQVGRARVGGIERASMWFGTATSWSDLSPFGATDSSAEAVDGGKIVGYAVIGGTRRASFWTGSAASWVDLHAMLPAMFGESYAEGISNDGGFTYVVGNGFNSVTNRNEALMWIRQNSTPVQPTSYTILQGLNFGGNLASLLNSDDDKVYVLCDEFDSNGEIEFISTLPAGTVSQLKFKFEGSASRNDLSQFVRMFNYSTNTYTNVSFQNTTLVDSVVEGTITTGVANYYSGTREVKSRVFWVPQADIDASDGWSQSCDQVLWTMN